MTDQKIPTRRLNPVEFFSSPEKPKREGGIKAPQFFATITERQCKIQFRFHNWALLIDQVWDNGNACTQYWDYRDFERVAAAFLAERGYDVSKKVEAEA